MNNRPIHDVHSIKHLLDLLTDSEIDVSLTSDSWLSPDKRYCLGTYNTKDNKTLAAVMVDLPLASSLACLLTRYMPGTAEDAVKAGVLTDELMLNLKEVMNVFCAKLNRDDTPHLVFRDAFNSHELPEPVQSLVAQTPINRVDCAISVPQYFDGHISFLTFD